MTAVKRSLLAFLYFFLGSLLMPARGAGAGDSLSCKQSGLALGLGNYAHLDRAVSPLLFKGACVNVGFLREKNRKNRLLLRSLNSAFALTTASRDAYDGSAFAFQNNFSGGRLWALKPGQSGSASLYAGALLVFHADNQILLHLSNSSLAWHYQFMPAPVMRYTRAFEMRTPSKILSFLNFKASFTYELSAALFSLNSLPAYTRLGGDYNEPERLLLNAVRDALAETRFNYPWQSNTVQSLISFDFPDVYHKFFSLQYKWVYSASRMNSEYQAARLSALNVVFYFKHRP